MTALALIASRARDLDLARLAVESLRVYAPQVQSCVIVTDDPHGRVSVPQGGGQVVWMPHRHRGAPAHAAAIHHARTLGFAHRFDYVVLMDNDAVVLSSQWWPWAVEALTRYAAVGPAHHDGVLHPSLMVMDHDWFHRVPTFASTYPNGWAEGRPWRDTAGTACDYIVQQQGQLLAIPGATTPEGWTTYGQPPLFAHLGSGTQSHHVSLWRYPLAAVGHAASQEQCVRVERRRQWLQWGWRRMSDVRLASPRARV
jgi:hypothetical protein